MLTTSVTVLVPLVPTFLLPLLSSCSPETVVSSI